MLLKTGDLVLVIAGNDRDVRGKILAVDRERSLVVVEGVNRVYKHVKRSQKNPQGGRLSKEMPTRVGVRYLPDGSKERYSKRSGASMGLISPPKKAYAKQS